MAYQRERTGEDYDWIECYVCGERQPDGLTDLAGPITTYDQACASCRKHGAPAYKPKDWVKAQSVEVITKRKAAEPPPSPPHKLSRAERESAELFARRLVNG